MSRTVIQVEGLGKSYRIGLPKRHDALSHVIGDVLRAPARLFRGGENSGSRANDSSSTNGNKNTHKNSSGGSPYLWALKDINFEVKEGDVKIDAEGFDLKVLSGASTLIGKTELFFIEAAVCCTYENSVSEVVRRMADNGYKLLDITDINRSPKFGVLWLLELVFLRNASQLLDSVTSYE